MVSFYQFHTFKHCSFVNIILVDRYDAEGFVESLPSLNIARSGSGCTKFIVSKNYPWYKEYEILK